MDCCFRRGIYSAAHFLGLELEFHSGNLQFLSSSTKFAKDPKSAGDREAQPATPPQRIASDADHTAVNALRILSMDMVDVADAGHLGAPLGLAPAAFVLWTEFATFSPSDPAWPNRDRIVFSCGHACALQYAALHLAGYDLPRAELQRLCKIGSRTPGHPENLLTPGIEVTTGPLGQGLANAVGFAIAERHLAARAPAPGLVDHRTWVFASDGDLMEGISYEASSLAGHLGLDKLTVLYDANGSTIDGSTRLAFTEDVAQRFGAQGWHVQRVRGADTDLDAIRGALRAATMSTSDAAAHESESRGKPRLVILETTLGYGSPKAGDHHIHSHPLTPEDAAATRKNLAWAVEEPFVVPEAARAPFTAAAQRGESRAHAWKERVRELAAGSPRESGRQDEHEKGDKAPWSILDWVSGSGSAGKEGGSGGTTSTVSTPPAGWAESLPTDTAPFQVHGASPQALRKTSGLILNHLAQQMGGILAGSADLASSNVTYLNDAGGDFSRENPAGRNLRFGIREHAMTAIANGIALHGSGLRPVASTFTVFTDYLKPALRLAALSGAPTVLVCTHDSVGVGEDGPTHQPIEQLAGLRAIPHLSVLRPADAEELIGCYQSAFDRTDGPTLLVLPRQAVPNLMGTQREGPGKGAYVVYQTNAAEGPNLVLLASGSEVDLAIKAAQVGREFAFENAII